EGLLAGGDFASCPLRPAAPEHGLPCPLHPAAPEHGLPCPLRPAAPEHGLPCPLHPAAPEHGLPCPLHPAAPEHGLPCPVLVLDFLGTFEDQDVRVTERRRLLRGCIQQLQTLARRTSVAVWVRQRSAVPQEALGFLDIVQDAAGQVWYPPRRPVLPALKQAALF